MLHFVPKADQAIAEMRRVARPGAVVGATVVGRPRRGLRCQPDFFDTAAILDPLRTRPEPRNYTRPMTRPGELTKSVARRGPHRSGRDDFVHPHGVRIVRRLLGTYVGKDGPQAEYVATLGGAERDRLRNAVRLAYIDGEPDGPRSYAALAWAVKGVVPD